MKKLWIVPTLLIAIASSNISFADETIVMVRHGEKPAAGLGQLNCQGLHRSLALPRVLQQKFGAPAAIFAPNPGIQKEDRGTPYNYIRPLATIEPTAIALELPVNTQFGLEDIDGLQQAVITSHYANATVFVAWEHRLVEEFARRILSSNHGDPALVPVWKSDDFDSIYIVTLRTDKNGNRTASFALDKENLNDLPTTCRE